MIITDFSNGSWSFMPFEEKFSFSITGIFFSYGKIFQQITWKFWLCSGTTFFFSNTTTGLPAMSRCESFICIRSRNSKRTDVQLIAWKEVWIQMQFSRTSRVSLLGNGATTEISFDPSGKTTWNCRIAISTTNHNQKKEIKKEIKHMGVNTPGI